MKRLFQIFAIGLIITFAACNQSQESESQTTHSTDKTQNEVVSDNGDIKPIYLTTDEFKDLVWNYEANPQEWVYNGEIPCVVDFYADWCKPCKIVAPIMDDLADHYKGKVQIYKVNTDNERELATVFQVRSIPSILFVPMEGRPAMQAGAMSKEDYIRIIDENILKINNKNKKTES